MGIDRGMELPNARNSDARFIARPWIALLLIVAAGLLIRVAVAAATQGTNDVYSWLAFIDAARTHGALQLYGITEWATVPTFDFNHGPLAALGVEVAAWVQDVLPIGKLVLPRLPAIAADAASTVLVFVLIARRSSPQGALIAAAMVAFNPVLILVSGFHGNTDPVFVALVLLTVVLLERELAVAAGIAFAAAAAIKIVPLVAAPAIVLSIRAVVTRRQFIWATLTASAALWLPPLLVDPSALIREVFLYRGIPGIWGMSSLAAKLGADLSEAWIGELWTLMVVAAVLASAWILNNNGRTPVTWSIATAFLVFVAVMPGFGVQYLVWPVLFLVVARPKYGAVYSIAAGAFLFATYAFWSGGGWSLGFANTWTSDPLWNVGTAIGKELLWGLVAVLAYLMHARQPSQPIADSHQPLDLGRSSPLV